MDLGPFDSFAALTVIPTFSKILSIIVVGLLYVRSFPGACGWELGTTQNLPRGDNTFMFKFELKSLLLCCCLTPSLK